MSNEQDYQQRASTGKYRRLFSHLSDLSTSEWRTTFGEIESIIGFELPSSARRHRPWWANGSRQVHSHALAWSAAGWETAEVDMVAETLLLRRKFAGKERPSRMAGILPVHSVGVWPPMLSLRREDLY
ncbi:MAG: hypothetical protein OXE17_01990 [Chloroflexi bacterium]|nr:hypothetical protein [Chloroflexota bacterium]